MEISQAEADRLLALDKLFVSTDALQFNTTQQFQQTHDLHSSPAIQTVM